MNMMTAREVLPRPAAVGVAAAVEVEVEAAVEAEVAVKAAVGATSQGAGHWAPDFSRWAVADAARHRAVVARDAQDRTSLLSDRAPDALLLEAAEARTGLPLRWQHCEAAMVDRWLGEAERSGRALAGLSAGEPGTGDTNGASHELSLLSLAGETSPAVRLLDAVLYDALKDRASDVHLEMRADGAEVRMRLDGVMLPLQRVAGRELAEQMVSRLKVMAELDIGERRLPQDGRFGLRAFGREIDFRLSVMPSVHGEDAVVRVLDRQAVSTAGEEGPSLSLATLGFDGSQRRLLLSHARAPHGMLLVTGPTGSGKTTTLYAAISEIHHGGEKIITIEDPVEYELPGVVQIPVNDRKGLTFARGLRSILRHDPDRVLVGEIRDAETAQIAVQAALTGHLVFSTVHANHVFDVIGRFAHMGLDMYNVVSALNLVLAQRLMRRLCEQCAQPLPDAEAERAVAALGAVVRAEEEAPERGGRSLADALAGDPAPTRAQAGPRLRRAAGCAACRGTGYRGRQAVAEALVFDDALRDMLVARAPMQQIKQAARERGMRSLRHEAARLVLAGHSTLEELERVVAAE